MSTFEKKLFGLTLLFLPLNYFVPTLFTGIFDAKTSNASQFYWTGLAIVLMLDVFFLLFCAGIIEVLLKRRKG